MRSRGAEPIRAKVPEKEDIGAIGATGTELDMRPSTDVRFLAKERLPDKFKDLGLLIMPSVMKFESTSSSMQWHDATKAATDRHVQQRIKNIEINVHARGMKHRSGPSKNWPSSERFLSHPCCSVGSSNICTSS